MKSRARSVIALAVLLSAGVASKASAQCTNTPLPEVGAVNPANGFPAYYVGADGLALQPCLDPAPFPAGFCGALPPLPNPLAPVAFPGNFFVEFPYLFAKADMTLPTGGRAILVHAVTGSFLGGVAPTPGLQLAFSRLRVRINNLLPFGTYTVTHPYGVEQLVANNLGVINVTFDVGILAPGFSGPLTAASRVGPSFLQWDASLPAPPAGFVGDGITPHAVTGSPCGTNFYRVEGPLLPPGGVQTNLFTVVGKKIDVCGNGILDVGEQCDDGNKLNGDCCSSVCKFEALGSPCTAATICTNNACNGAGSCGFASLNNGIACTDGNVCTVGDTCTAGACVGGARNCDDLNVCTTDLCTPPAVGCENLNNALACDDGNAATAGDSCSGGKCMGSIRRATLTRNAGEDPSLAGFPAVGDVRTNGVSTRISLTNMDPARYPAGCTGVRVSVGGISATGTVTPFAAQAAPLRRATAVNILANGTVAAGSSVDFRVSCTVGGVTHQTRWAGVVR